MAATDTYKTILVPVDGSENSIRAVDRAVELAKVFESSITILHVIDIQTFSQYRYSSARKSEDNLSGRASYEDMLKTQSEIVEDYEKVKGRDLLEAVKARVPEGIPVETTLVYGYPKSEIIRAAEVRNPDLIVIGSMGVGGVLGFFMGGVSTYVASQAKCPVLIVK